MKEIKQTIYLLQTNFEVVDGDPGLSTIVSGLHSIKAFKSAEDADKAKTALMNEILLELGGHAANRFKSTIDNAYSMGQNVINQYKFIQDIMRRIDVNIITLDLEASSN